MLCESLEARRGRSTIRSVLFWAPATLFAVAARGYRPTAGFKRRAMRVLKESGMKFANHSAASAVSRRENVVAAGALFDDLCCRVSPRASVS